MRHNNESKIERAREELLKLQLAFDQNVFPLLADLGAFYDGENVSVSEDPEPEEENTALEEESKSKKFKAGP